MFNEMKTSDLQHSGYQKKYFGNRIKTTMLPVSTPYVRRHVEEVVRFAGITSRDRVLDVGRMVFVESAGLRNFEFARFGFFPPGFANKPWGARTENGLEKIRFLKPFLPFQLIKAYK